MANMRDIAKEAGVSIATVSRAINNADTVTSETTRRIQEAMQKLHYKPKSSGGMHHRTRSHMLLVIIPDFGNAFFSDILRGMNDESLKNGYALLLAASNSIVEREREFVKFLHNRQADGVIFLSPLLSGEELQAIDARYPLVQCCEYNENTKLTHVSIDNYAACCQAMEFLIRLGHRNIAMLSSTNSFVSTKQREAAYKQTLAAHGLPLEPQFLRRGTYSFTNGYENMKCLLKRRLPITAVLAIADTVAAGASRAIQEAGLRVPEDIAVVGFDNVDLCNMVTPTLTTIAQPRHQLGATAVELLLDKIAGNTERRGIYLSHELIVRGSTR